MQTPRGGAEEKGSDPIDGGDDLQASRAVSSSTACTPAAAAAAAAARVAAAGYPVAGGASVGVGSGGGCGEVTTLRVRLPEGGARPLLLKMGFLETVADLHAAVAGHLGLHGDDFELRTSFPNRAYGDKKTMAETLQEAGLTPNAALMLRRL